MKKLLIVLLSLAILGAIVLVCMSMDNSGSEAVPTNWGDIDRQGGHQIERDQSALFALAMLTNGESAFGEEEFGWDKTTIIFLALVGLLACLWFGIRIIRKKEEWRREEE